MSDQRPPWDSNANGPQPWQQAQNNPNQPYPLGPQYGPDQHYPGPQQPGQQWIQGPPQPPPTPPKRRHTGCKIVGAVLGAIVLIVIITSIAASGGGTTADQPATTHTSARTAPSSSRPKTTAPETTTPTPSPVPTPTPSPVLATVPKVVGLSRAKAQAAITRVGLKVSRVEKQPSGREPGTVLRQSISPGSKLEPKSEVALIVAKPFPRVPDVVGLRKSSAIHRLRSAGFRVATTTERTTSGTDNAVLSQSPSGQTRKGPGATVHLVISDLHEPVAPPAPKPPPQQHTCTTTSSGSCIQGGEFCPQADYGLTGYDADGTAYVCKGDETHPHWE